MATPFGPNQAMKAFSAPLTRVPAKATHTATGPRNQERGRHHRDRCPAVREQAVDGEQRTEHREDRELDDLHHLLCVLRELSAQIRTADSDHDRSHEHCDEAVSTWRKHRQSVCGERDRRVRTEPFDGRESRESSELSAQRRRVASTASRSTRRRARKPSRDPRPEARSATTRSSRCSLPGLPRRRAPPAARGRR